MLFSYPILNAINTLGQCVVFTRAKKDSHSRSMFLVLAAFLSFFASIEANQNLSFAYNGFQSANISLDGLAQVTPNGLLQLTNATDQKTAHAFFTDPVKFKNSTSNATFSFSTTFVFAIVPLQFPNYSSQGIAFVIAPTRGLPGSFPSHYLGLFNNTDNGNATNHVVAVELDTIWSAPFRDLDDNHVGIDINDLRSVKSFPAGYYDKSTKRFQNLTLNSGQPMQVWVDYDGERKQMNVTMAPINVGKPSTPLLSLSRDLSPILKDTMYVGFSSSTGSVRGIHYILGWSFRINGQVQELDLSKLPKLPRFGPKEVSRLLTIGLPIVSVSLAIFVLAWVVYVIKRKRRYAEVMEDWELDYGPHRFKYKDLYIATKGFREGELLGTGGFGRVYKGVLPSSKVEIAVKRVSHESRQGMREFVAEIVSMGQLRHRNLVPLLGYCRRKGELLLVYDYMPNGSLDKYIYNDPKLTLSWSQRFQVIKGVASGLLYLHEEWEKVVIHRDVKASNVLLDAELNGRLGDFGLARLYDHGTDPQTTHVVGTLGYLDPVHTRTGKATTSTDVYAFGAFLLEVACGRKPIELSDEPGEDFLLVDWVFSCWKRGDILEAKDSKLGEGYSTEELELVLKLGLLCSHSIPEARPNMRQVLQYFRGDAPLPEIPSPGYSSNNLPNHLSSKTKSFQYSHSLVESVLSGGR